MTTAKPSCPPMWKTTLALRGTAPSTLLQRTANHLESLSAKSQSLLNWEIHPSEVTIMLRPEGCEYMLGEGSCASVLLGLEGGTKKVALKVLHNQQSAADRAGLLQEAQLLSECQGANIVGLSGVCADEGRLMLIMEFCSGGSLHSAIQSDVRGVLKWYQRGKFIALDIARGLAFLHNRASVRGRVAHCDLKSANILLTGDYKAKIADFGFAQLLHTASCKLENYSFRGTFTYAAPELLMGDRCNEKVDIFSFGVILWEIVMGEPARRGGLHDPCCPLDCPQEIADLIDDCMSPEPDHRPSALEIVEKLREISADAER